MTHGDAPGASAVGFVGARETFAADKTGLCNQVSSTEEYRPVRKQSCFNRDAPPLSSVCDLTKAPHLFQTQNKADLLQFGGRFKRFTSVTRGGSHF